MLERLYHLCLTEEVLGSVLGVDQWGESFLIKSLDWFGEYDRQ